MMYRDNTAYDFELFAPKKKEVVEIPVKPKVGISTRRKAATRAHAGFRNRLVSIGAVVTVLVLVVAQLHCQLQNSEVVDQIHQTEKSIETLQSENTRLQVELDAKVSFSNMERIAKEMGMQKMTVAQMEYINLCCEDKAEVVNGNGGLLAAVQDLF